MAKLSSWKLIFLAIALLFVVLLTFFCSTTAFADETQWVRIVNNNTALYTNASTIKVTCFLEKSYYLKILGSTTDFFYVQLMEGATGFPPISGYVKKSDVETTFDTPLNPIYPNVSVTVNTGGSHLYFSPLFTSSVIIIATNTQKMSYYGSVKDGDTLWYYVYFANTFGYVDSKTVTAPQIALHPTPLTDDTEPAITEPTEPPKEPNPTIPEVSLSEIFLIVFVVLLSIGLVLALFLPSNSTKSNNDTTERYF